MEKARDITFDIAKGIGIVLVVIGHYVPAGAPGWYMAFVRFIYHFHMPLFFLIAGFFYDRSSREESYRLFVWNKFQRLMIPYFILSWTIVAAKMVVGEVLQVDHPVDIHALYRVLYLPEAGFFLWFVYVLFLIFCIVPLFKPGKRLALLLLATLALVFWDTAPEYFCIGQLCRNFIFFAVGMWVARESRIEHVMYRAPLLWLGITVGLAWIYTTLPDGSVVVPVLSVVLGITGSFMVILFSRVIARQGGWLMRALNQLGIMSMTIYLFHTWFMGAGKAILIHILSTENIIEFVLSALFIIGTGIACPIVLYRWVWAKNKFTARIFK